MRAAAPAIDRRSVDLDLDVLPSADRPAAEALVATMAGWDASELEAYRTSVIADLSALGKGRVGGFLAVELAALSAVDGLGA